MTAYSFRDKRRAMTVLAVSVLAVACAATAAEPVPAAAAETPVFGAWRNLQTEAGYAPAQRNLAFAMLPQAATRGDRFAILDREGKRAVCCLQVAGPSLGVAALRDVTDLDEALSRLDDDLQRRRTRHVVTEDQRVLDAVELGRAGRLAELGPLLDASHASMRDDFEITVETVDLAVETARAAGALGARMTGGGFGGCIIALCQQDSAEQVGQAVAEAFAQAGFNQPAWFSAVAEQGARRLS